jgi:hypothetical protein
LDRTRINSNTVDGDEVGIIKPEASDLFMKFLGEQESEKGEGREE